MFFRIVAISLAPLLISVAPVAAPFELTQAEQACAKYTPRADLKSITEKCDQKTKNKEQEERDEAEAKKIKKFNDTPSKKTPKLRKLAGPHYKIRDYNQCIPGLETIMGCTSNPDIKPCTDGSYPIVRQFHSLQGKFIRRQIYCPGDPPPPGLPEDVDSERDVEVQISPEKFRTYPIKGSKIQSSPNKFSLRNGHTHFWAIKEVQEFKSEISDQNVRIKAIPIQWNWNYGDGTTKNLNFPGEAMPSHTLHDETKTSHSYTKTGKFGVTVTTLYRGEFSVDGGPWQAIPGQAAVPSNTLPIDVWRTEKELIAND